jgi:hypothetical protein
VPIRVWCGTWCESGYHAVVERRLPSPKRARGEIEDLASGALRVKVYAGIDPITKRRLYLRETVPAGPHARRQAERVRTRLLNEVYERRNPRTDATVAQLIDRHITETPHPLQRGFHSFQPARPAGDPVRVPDRLQFSRQYLGLDEFLVRTCRSMADRRHRRFGPWSVRVVEDDVHAGDPAARAYDAAHVPVARTRTRVLPVQALRLGPERNELLPRHPQVAARNRVDHAGGQLHSLRVARGTDVSGCLKVSVSSACG